jgi:glycosyltransferase involved in cell wall biosynthesis
MESSISIIVPIYKVESYLDRCINSLVGQTYKNIEIILVDDGSPDKCPQKCDDWAAKNNRIVVIHKENGGLSDARNAGIKRASGDYLLFVDSDDYIELDSCEKFIEIADKTQADIIVGNALQETSRCNIPMDMTNLEEGNLYSNTEFIKLAIRAREWYAPACFSLYKRNMYKENHLEYKKGLLHEDMEMLPRVFFAAKTVSFLNKEFYHYVSRDDSIMGSSNKDKNGKHIMKIYAEWKRLFDDVEDTELRNLLYGFLIKCYLHSVKELKMTDGIQIDGINKKFVFKYGLDAKERLKAVLFDVSPRLYTRL